MEADEAVSENLKMQFKALQEQQQKRMKNLLEKKKETQHSLKQDNKENHDKAFGIPDALSLSLLAPETSESDIGTNPALRKKADTTMSPEVKALHEKLSAVNLKASEYRNQLQSTKQELKMTQKLLTHEVRDLETQLNCHKSKFSENDANEDPLSITDPRKSSAQVKNQLRIRTLEREKKEALEDHEDVKKKLEGSKARNKVLSNEVKTLKEQISTLMEKGKHDNELVDALQEEKNVESEKALGKKLNDEIQKQNCLIEQLKQMVAEREAQVKELEEVESGMDSGSTLSTESLEEENQNLAPQKEDYSRIDSSVRTVSKMGHTLVDSAATSFPASSGRVSEHNEAGLRTLQAQITEYKTLSQAAEVERDHLIELVSILQKRVDESITKVWEAEKKFQEQQHKYVALEQHSTKMSWNAGDKKDLPSAQLSEVPLEFQLEELSTQGGLPGVPGHRGTGEGDLPARFEAAHAGEELSRSRWWEGEGAADTPDDGPVEDAGGPQLEGPRGQLLSSIMMYS
ncbi:hypothetical protein E2320_001484 [Naja naja]|nr:hypothetical protein E2320_001484 [Naja naja]